MHFRAPIDESKIVKSHAEAFFDDHKSIGCLPGIGRVNRTCSEVAEPARESQTKDNVRKRKSANWEDSGAASRHMSGVDSSSAWQSILNLSRCLEGHDR